MGKIHFIITGGTIDSYYDGTKDTAVTNEQSIIPKFIASLKLYSEHEFTTVCMKDSRAINEHDLKQILETVEKSLETKIIITHGTYTMPDTARYMKAHTKRNDQTIVLTGSMIPIQGFSPSDGPFSLGFAYAEVLQLPPGVYITMNGKVFNAEEATKIISEGRFISLFNKE